MENEDEEYETYEEVPTEYDYDDDSDFELGDYAFIGFMTILACAVFAFVIKTISKHLKHINLKVGKLELGVESKDGENKNGKD